MTPKEKKRVPAAAAAASCSAGSGDGRGSSGGGGKNSKWVRLPLVDLCDAGELGRQCLLDLYRKGVLPRVSTIRDWLLARGKADMLETVMVKMRSSSGPFVLVPDCPKWLVQLFTNNSPLNYPFHEDPALKGLVGPGAESAALSMDSSVVFLRCTPADFKGFADTPKVEPFVVLLLAEMLKNDICICGGAYMAATALMTVGLPSVMSHISVGQLTNLLVAWRLEGTLDNWSSPSPSPIHRSAAATKLEGTSPVVPGIPLLPSPPAGQPLLQAPRALVESSATAVGVEAERSRMVPLRRALVRLLRGGAIVGDMSVPALSRLLLPSLDALDAESLPTLLRSQEVADLGKVVCCARRVKSGVKEPGVRRSDMPEGSPPAPQEEDVFRPNRALLHKWGVLPASATPKETSKDLDTDDSDETPGKKLETVQEEQEACPQENQDTNSGAESLELVIECESAASSAHVEAEPTTQAPVPGIERTVSVSQSKEDYMPDSHRLSFAIACNVLTKYEAETGEEVSYPSAWPPPAPAQFVVGQTATSVLSDFYSGTLCPTVSFKVILPPDVPSPPESSALYGESEAPCSLCAWGRPLRCTSDLSRKGSVDGTPSTTFGDRFVGRVSIDLELT